MPLSHGAERHSFKHLKIVTVGFFQVCFSDFGASSSGFFGDWNHNQIPPPPPRFFHFVIGSLFNLVKKIGQAWERQNSFGDGFCCFRVVRIVVVFFLSAGRKSASLCQNLMKY